MSDLNVFVLGGRLVADPELRFTPKGTAVTSLRVASSRFYKDKEKPDGELKKNSLFITADAFGKLAERISNYIKKGQPVVIRGRLMLNEWKGTDGKTRQTYKIFAEDVNWIYPAKNKAADGSNDAHSNEIDSSDLDTDNDESIPF